MRGKNVARIDQTRKHGGKVGKAAIEMKTGVAIALSAICAGLGACNGWPRAPELETVRQKPEKYATYAPTAASQAQVLAFENRRWAVSPATEELIGARLQQVGTAGGVGVYAAPGTSPPYDVLYTPAAGNKWHRVVPVD